MGESAELDQVRQQLAELEERLDFAERLVAQPRESQPRTIVAPENTQ